MKIFIDAVTTGSEAYGNVTSTTLPIEINWYFDDGVTSGGGNYPIPWSVNDTATTLNNAIKTQAIQSMLDQAQYTVNLATDQLFVMCGFLGA